MYTVPIWIKQGPKDEERVIIHPVFSNFETATIVASLLSLSPDISKAEVFDSKNEVLLEVWRNGEGRCIEDGIEDSEPLYNDMIIHDKKSRFFDFKLFR